MKLIGFVIALIFGIFQMFLLSRILRAVTSGRIKVTALYLLLKLIVYIVGIGLLLLVFSQHIIICACGYAAGMPLGAVVWFIYISFFKKSDNDGR